MIYGSICSGIEAATVAWEPLGWKPAFYSEDAIADVVLRYRPKPVSDAAKDRKKRAKRVARKVKADG